MRTRWLKNLSVVKPCWICLLIPTTMVEDAIDEGFRELGYEPSVHNGVSMYTRITHDSWYIPWQKTATLIDQLKIGQRLQVAIVPGDDRPSFEEAELHQAEVGEIAAANDQVWLIEALENEQLMCQFMPVVDLNGSIFGYESLVRARRTDGTTANGGHIFTASRILRIEHLIDRHLHELSIRSFAAQKLPGFLFINLLPGFIQRPEFYLGGLGDACVAAGMDSKRIVLDCSNSENPRDIQHLKSIFKFCREKGYL
ncbi:MAG: EAL domain-containing protein, partial [Alphaproteobacteria bacterium]|nr:EAL domain-containing protein [Alphaproteobacteria bacterium]